MVEPLPTNPNYCYADLLGWPESERWELIDGVAYSMTPAPSRRHQEIITELITQINNFLKGSACRVYAAPFDVRLPKADEDSSTTSTVLQPDITIVCEREKLDDRGCFGTPTVIMEVLSPETAHRDLQEKLLAYQRAGVPEYWVISPREKLVMVFLPDENGRFASPIVYTEQEEAPVTVLPGLRIHLADVFAE